MALNFNIKTRDALGRIGILEVNGRRLETPALMPVINPNIMLFEPAILKERFGFNAIITNAYILFKGHSKEDVLENGIHRYMNYDGIIMTDSGTFQSHVYGQIDITNSEIVRFQREIGVDIGTVLDVFTEPTDPIDVAKKKIIETLERVKEALVIKGNMALNTTIQGGIYPELRSKMTQQLTNLGCDYYTIGGVVPLMESYDYSKIVKIILAVRKSIDISKPLHLFGGGHPLIFPIAVALGIDVFDSASYAKYARDGRMMFSHGTMHVEDMKYIPCKCPACINYKNANDLASADRNERISAIAMHNLYISMCELQNVKNALRNGTLWDLVEQRCTLRPEMMDAVVTLKRHLPRYYMYATRGRKSINTPNILALSRPEIVIYNHRLIKRYTPVTTTHLLLVEDYIRPFSNDILKIAMLMRSANIDAHLCLIREYGLVPYELVWHYPNAQSNFPQHLNPHTKAYVRRFIRKYIKAKGYHKVTVLKSKAIVEHVQELLDVGILKRGLTWHEDMWQIRASLDMAYGPGAGRIIIPDAKGFRAVRSRNTGMIRNVFYGDTHVVSIDATTGTAFVRLPAAEKLYQMGITDQCITVTDESAEYNAMGRSVFTRFIVDMGPEIVPGDEIYVVSVSGCVVATGRTLIGAMELQNCSGGIAVNIRFHKGKS